jgi:hypothetical protein
METKAKWNVSTTIEKYATHEDYLNGVVSEIKKIDGNKLLSAGVTDLWRLVAGIDNTGSGQEHYDYDHAYIGVGDDATLDNDPAQSTWNGLVSTANVWYKKMDLNYPAVTANKITFKSTFTGSGTNNDPEAPWAWREWSVARGAATPTEDFYDAAQAGTVFTPSTGWLASNINMNLNRKAEEMGTKAPQATWVITVEISLT